MINKFEKKLTEMENKINPNETNILNDVEKQNEKIENLEKMQDNQIKQDKIFENKIDSMENILKTLREAISEKAVLIGVITQLQNETQSKEYLDELEFLTDTAGGVVVKRFVQKLEKPHPKMATNGKILEV